MNQTSTIDKVKEAAKTAQTVPRNRLQEINHQHRSASLQLKSLLGIEKRHTGELKTLVKQTGAELSVLQYMESTGQCFKEFPTESFGWRNDEGLPELMPFLLNSATVSIRYTGKHKNLPSSVKPFYQDVADLLAGMVRKQRQSLVRKGIMLNIAVLTAIWALTVIGCIKGVVAQQIILVSLALTFTSIVSSCFWYIDHTQHLEVQATFKGLIPEPVRLHIRELEKAKIFDEVFLLAEVPDLQVTTFELPQPRSPRYGDPLVVGYDGNKFWLTAAFDTSPVEALAQSTAV